MGEAATLYTMSEFNRFVNTTLGTPTTGEVFPEIKLPLVVDSRFVDAVEVETAQTAMEEYVAGDATGYHPWDAVVSGLIPFPKIVVITY